MAYTEQQVRDIIQHGETDQVELKAEVRDAGLLSRIISGFANGSGGVVVIGAQSPHHIPGCDRKALSTVYDAARKQLNQTQVGALEFIQLDGKDIIGLLKVAKSDKSLSLPPPRYVRKGSGTMSMTADHLRQSRRQRRTFPPQSLQPDLRPDDHHRQTSPDSGRKAFLEVKSTDFVISSSCLAPPSASPSPRFS